MKITNIETLEAYISTLSKKYFEQYCYLDCSPSEIQQRLNSFYQYQNVDNEPAAIFSMFEGDITDNGTGASYQFTFYCQLMFLQKADKNDIQSLIEVRNRTWSKAMKVIGQMINDQIATLEFTDNALTPAENEDGKWSINLPEGKLLPETDVAGLGAYGWSLPFDLTIPVNTTMFG